MSATNATTNYALPLFIGTDKPAWLVDWNSAMSAIDAAIKGVDTDVQGAITSISGLSSTVASHTSSISTITGQITVISNNLNTATGNINTINSLIGNGTPTTTDQTLIGAINELHANQGDLADLTTPAASLVAAINAISGGGSVAASAVSFDNTGTGLAATNVQTAIEEVKGLIQPATSLAWTKIGDGSGSTPVSIPAETYNEYLVTFNNATKNYSIVILPALYTAGEMFRVGEFYNSSNGAVFGVYNNNNDFALAVAAVNGADVTATTTFSVYAR